MATLIELNENGGNKVYINPQHVAIVEPVGNGSRVITDVIVNNYGTINRTPKAYVVKESPSHIVWLMKNS